MSRKRAGRAAVAAGVVCSAGLAASAASAASATVAWGTTTSAPAGTLADLFGVAASSSSDVLAAGGYNPGESPTAVLTRPYAVHWNGSTWAQVRVPSIGALDAVTVTSASVWVAGGNKAERFNGSAWTLLPALPAGVS